MKVLKKFFVSLIAMLPMSSWALGPFAIGALGLGAGIVGMSIWRSVAPVDMQEAFNFFSTCWTCQVFSDVMVAMSSLLPGVYTSLGKIIIPSAATLLAVLMAWRLTAGFLNGKMDDASKIAGNFGTYVIKLALLIGLLLMPLPRFITSVLIEPAVTIGTSFDYIVSDNNSFSECMLATAVADPVSVSDAAASYGAFSPKIRHQLACEVANVHQITGLGITVGWTLMNMSFDVDYMHKVLFLIPIFPNIPMFFAGLLIFVLYFFALLPIPLYFLEIFINLSMDLIMLPLMLMAWMFDDDNFAIFPKGGRTIRQMIDDVIKGVVGIALTIVFLAFSIMFLNAAFGDWNGASLLEQAMTQNDSKLLIDGLMMNNDSIITVIMMGIFIAMFMTMIPQLTQMLFKIKISDKYYQTLKTDLGLLWDGFNKIMPGNKSNNANSNGNNGGASGGGAGGSGDDENHNYTRIEYLESTGMQYISTGINPNNDTTLIMKVKIKPVQNIGRDAFLFGARDGAHNNSFAVEIFHGSNPSSVYIEHGSFFNDTDVGQSLADETITVDMRSGETVFYNNSGTPMATISHAGRAFSASYDIALFAMNDQGVVRNESSCKIYSCTIYDNGSLVRNFIPVLDGSDVPCLYDTVEHRFYYNDGTGSFSAGPTI